MIKATQAVLLSAGLGTRMRAVTDNLKIPKVMVPLLGKPLLEYHILELKKFGIREFFINLHYLPEKIVEYFGEGEKWGVKINYQLEAPEILGTAGGVKNFEKLLGPEFLVLYGDTFYGIDFERFFSFWNSLPENVIGMVAARRTDHPMDSDLAVAGEDGLITRFILKPHTELPEGDIWGTSAPYIFKKEALEYVPEKKYYEIDHNLVPDLLSRGYKYYAYKLGEGEFRKDIGTPERYKQVEEYLKKSL